MYPLLFGLKSNALRYCARSVEASISNIDRRSLPVSNPSSDIIVAGISISDTAVLEIVRSPADLKGWINTSGKGLALSKLDASPEELAEPFAEDMRELVRTARALSPVVAVATFSVQYRRSQPPQDQARAGSTNLYYMPYMTVSTLLDSFEAYNTVIRDIASEASVILIEGEHDIPGDAIHFNDSVHFKDDGSVAMAERVASALINSMEVRRMIESRAD